jgi:YesN/AraC family two-component response regulator
LPQRENEVGLNATVEHHTQQNESNHQQYVQRIVFLGLGLLLIIGVDVMYWVRKIIKEYQGKNFNNYINGLRIEFITEKLYNNPE